MEMRTYMWEILVPYNDNKGTKYPIQHHWDWDSFVKTLTNGLTIHKKAKGQWVSQDGTLFKDQMIPVRILCTEKVIEDIIQFTLEHYDQEAVLAYEVSNNVKLRYKDGRHNT